MNKKILIACLALIFAWVMVGYCQENKVKREISFSGTMEEYVLMSTIFYPKGSRNYKDVIVFYLAEHPKINFCADPDTAKKMGILNGNPKGSKVRLKAEQLESAMFFVTSMERM